ncbi:MAG: hypothetical protein JWP36_2331 [Paucimonas sp.]|nr:hypothetical protein [Paucimonas sp.]
MYAIAIAVFGAMLLTWQMAIHSPPDSQQRKYVSAEVAAANFWAYREAVIDYLASHSGHDGPVDDSQLTPHYSQDGFTKYQFPDTASATPGNASWASAVNNGTLYVYSTAPPPEVVAYAIAQRGGGSIAVGMSQRGTTAPTMTSVADGQTGVRGVALPGVYFANVSGNIVVLGR